MKRMQNFTFQYVSIISSCIPPFSRGLTSFTFQYVSIISYPFLQELHNVIYLHSNMFLLFRLSDFYSAIRIIFIYIPICFYYFKGLLERIAIPYTFTFQYVSIISEYRPDVNETVNEIYIPICFYYFNFVNAAMLSPPLFTFQYVSIISASLRFNKLTVKKFTFQYVSIISGTAPQGEQTYVIFTFQYVSIISIASIR